MPMIAASFAVALATAAPPLALRPELAPFGFLMDACWSTTFPCTRDVDTHCFSSLFGGQHVRDVHVVRGPKGVYRGETIYSWDKAAKTVRYSYYNSFGDALHGTMRPRGADLMFGQGEAEPSILWRRSGADGYEVVADGRVLRFSRRLNRPVNRGEPTQDLTVNVN